MASVSFTYGGDYDSNNTVVLDQNALNYYSGPSGDHAFGPGSSDRYILNDTGNLSDSGSYFTDSQRFVDTGLGRPIPQVLSGDKYSVYLDLSDNTGFLNLAGGSFGDILRAGSGNDTLNGGGGNDVLEGGSGGNTIDGGSGINTISYEHNPTDTSGAMLVDLSVFAAQSLGSGNTFDNLTNIQNIRGSDSILHDVLIGDANNNRIEGGGGDDSIDGGGGTDTASYEHSGSAVTVNLTTGINTGGDAEGDSLTAIENLLGSTFADSVTGDANANTLYGNGGSGGGDSLYGEGGSDRLVLIDTPSIVDGGTGTDSLFVRGGTFSLTDANYTAIEKVYVGNSTTLDMAAVTTGAIITSQSKASYQATITGTTGDDTITAGRGGDTIHGGGGGDIIRGGGGFGTLYGDAGNDTLIAGKGGAFLSGGAGEDTLRGGSGVQSTLSGGTDNDRIVAGAGGSTIDGGAGHDVLFAGAGTDIFNFSGNYGRDEILRFDLGNDVLDVSNFATEIGNVHFASVHGGRDTLITFAGDTDASHKIIVHDITADTLRDEGHFVF